MICIDMQPCVVSVTFIFSEIKFEYFAFELPEFTCTFTLTFIFICKIKGDNVFVIHCQINSVEMDDNLNFHCFQVLSQS